MTIEIVKPGSIPAAPRAHAVQFYERPEALHDVVADFLADGFADAEPAVVIAAPENRSGIAAAMAAKGFDADDLQRSGRLTFLDARETMATFMAGRMPNESLFLASIGGVLASTARAHRGARIRAYGEMVDLLWRDGAADAAIRVEELWDDLAADHHFSLLCGYHLGGFYRHAHGAAFQSVCDHHDTVLPSESSASSDRESLLRQIAVLQQRGEALKTEIAHRQQLEHALREALTERWEAEDALRRSEHELKDFLEHATIGLHWVGADGTILWVNDAELNLLGHTRDEYLGHNIAEFHADPATSDDILATLSAGGEIRERHARLLAKDGSIRHVAISSNVFFEDGRFVHTRCFTRDITEQKRLEEERAFILDATTVLNQSLDYPSRLRDLAQLVVPRLADSCAVDIANDDGTSERVAMAHSPGVDVALDDSDSLVVPMQVGERTLGTITLGGHHCSMELAMELARRAASAIDNSRLFRLAQEGNRAKDEFLATLSHELRTPLTAILGWARLLRMGPLDAETTATALETIERSASTQAALIDDILDLSKAVSGKISLQKDLVNVGSVVESAIETVRLAATAKRVALDHRLPATPAFVMGDATRLQQIVWNLLSNAIKFSRPDAVVTVEVERTFTHTRIVVRDEGVGIRREFLPHVFEAFRQAEASTTRTYGGLGLGLAIVKSLAELHGGSVVADSAGEGQGSTFCVTLPLVKSVHPAAMPAMSAAADLSGTSILVVDDDDDTRMMVATALRGRGGDVRTASSVAEARAMLVQARPDVVVTDIAMPQCDGYSLLEHLRLEANGLSGIPVIALTALGRPEDEARIRAAGVRAFARKPIEPGHLTDIVAASVAR